LERHGFDIKILELETPAGLMEAAWEELIGDDDFLFPTVYIPDPSRLLNGQGKMWKGEVPKFEEIWEAENDQIFYTTTFR